MIDTERPLKVLVLHGPNLNLLGERDPRHYGAATLPEIDARLAEAARKRDVIVEARQSNLEGELVSWVQEAAFGGRDVECAAVVINPGAYAHTSLALADAIEEVVKRGVPVIEVHLSNVHGREPSRARLVTARAASGLVTGLGPLSYDLGLEAAIACALTQTR